MKPLHDSSEHPVPARSATWPWLLCAGVIFVLSVFGLLGIPVGVYDESFLLLDARLVRSGSLPYLDFYAHYGPLGFTLIAAGYNSGIRNPGILLRVLQSASLAVAALLLFLTTRGKRGRTGARLGPAAAAISVFALANVFRSPAFLGFVFCVAALVMAALSRGLSSRATARLFTWAAGIFLVLAGLVRPAFGAYTAVAIAAVGLAEASTADPGRAARSRLYELCVAVLLSLPVIWIILYRRISPAVALQATVFGPGRLMGGGKRFLNPSFLLSPEGRDWAAWGGALAVGLLAAASASWIAAARSSSTRALVLVAGLGATLGTLRLQRSANPAPEATLLAGLLITVGLVAAFRMRREMAGSPSLAAGALFGITAMTFTHYFLARCDRAHLAPTAGLATVAAAFAWPHLGKRRRIATVAVLGAITVLFPQLPMKAATDVVRGARIWATPFPAATVPRDAADAVRFADQHADAASRFVAVASTHAVTSADPVLLFLLSSRRPYTRWYSYDPGVQDSPAVQEEMARELVNSGSRTAIVWDARLFVFEPQVANLGRKTWFDEVFSRLYPVSVARFGNYEIRLRAEGR